MKKTTAELKLELYSRLAQKINEEITASELLELCALAVDTDIPQTFKEKKLLEYNFNVNLLNKEVCIKDTDKQQIKKS